MSEESMSEKVYQYDEELFSGLDKKSKTTFIKNFINNLAKELHNTGLIVKDMSPNENIIYHLYSDGTITRQKGGWAYGRRSVTDLESYCVKPSTFFSFPEKGQYEGDTYCIITLEECKKVKNLMNKFLLHI